MYNATMVTVFHMVIVVHISTHKNDHGHVNDSSRRIRPGFVVCLVLYAPLFPCRNYLIVLANSGIIA